MVLPGFHKIVDNNVYMARVKWYTGAGEESVNDVASVQCIQLWLHKEGGPF